MAPIPAPAGRQDPLDPFRLGDGPHHAVEDHPGGRGRLVEFLAHRLVLDAQVTFSGQTGRTVVEDILKQLPVPA